MHRMSIRQGDHGFLLLILSLMRPRSSQLFTNDEFIIEISDTHTHAFIYVYAYIVINLHLKS